MVYTISGIRFPVLPSLHKSTLRCDRRTSSSHSFFLNKNSSFSRTSLYAKFSRDSETKSSTIAESDKVLIPEDQDNSVSLTDQLENPDITSEDAQNLEDLTMKDENKYNLDEAASSYREVGDEKGSVISSSLVDVNTDTETKKTSIHSDEKVKVDKPKIIPPPGTGQKIYEIDPLLQAHRQHLDFRATGITYREWAPGAKSAALVGDFNNWNPNADVMTKDAFGVWEIFLPNNADGSPPIPHGSRVKIHMDTPSGIKDSIPAWIKFSVQAPGEIPYNGIYYDPPEEEKYVFKHPQPKRPRSIRIYESHIGMSSPEPKINTYANFRDDVLPRIKKLGYNAVQIMAIQEHSYYASFGYHVTNFFAPSSRFGTPEDLKSLIDRAHELGLLVLMDIVHSHASNNTLDGLNMFDGTDGHYFHPGTRGYHWMWDSRLFNYGSWEVLRYLLSNARWWLDEYKFDGFRFDGVTSMMYTHHGLQVSFTGNYSEYFGLATDVEAVVYMMLVNDLIHGLFPEAVSIGEDVSGMPTFCLPTQDGGIGFNYRLHMAVADKWIELLKKQDEDWRMGDIVHTLTNRRWLEKCVVYAESHDQALVGDKTLAFWLMDKDMYDFMALDRPSTPLIDRGIALHKMIRLITMGLGGEGYLNFMGNEFGHPEWIDFPRGEQHLPNGKIVPGNNNSYDKCRRRFDLGDADYLRYHGMQEFDRAMQHLEERYGFMTSEHQYISRKNEGDRVIIFERDNLVFVFNFHWTNSYSDYKVGCLKPGKYKIVLDSDDTLFGGFNRLNHTAEYFTSEGWYDDRPRSFLVYAPCRTAVVYALVDKVESEPIELSVGVEPDPIELSLEVESEPIQQSVEVEP
ncbi:hypothetical protein RYX36_031804 [Vicia faba]